METVLALVLMYQRDTLHLLKFCMYYFENVHWRDPDKNLTAIILFIVDF